VITPPFTFLASATAIMVTGACLACIWPCES
jgi:dTDP-4-amino-4,6-dideoxygalactose transaminase